MRLSLIVSKLYKSLGFKAVYNIKYNKCFYD